MEYKVSYREKDGGVQAIINYKDGDKWRQKAKQGFRIQKDAKPWIDKTLKELKETVTVVEEFRGITFGKFKEIFLKDKQREAAYNSIKFYKRTFAKFKDLDNIPLTDVGYINIKPCVDKMIDEGLKNSTIKDYLAKLRTVFNHAIDNYEIITTNPVNIKKYKLPIQIDDAEEKVKALNENEVDDLLSRLKGRDYFICLIAVKCGLRLGEINGIVDGINGAIDFKNGELHVKQQWKELEKGKYGLGSLKTKNSYRTVPIPKKYIPKLEKYTQTCVKDLNNRIFIDNTNNRTGERLRRKFNRWGYDISVHNLRHTYATTLLSNGLDFETVAELMGDTVEMVIRTYSHVIDDMRKNAKTRIDNIL
jgi:integrase